MRWTTAKYIIAKLLSPNDKKKHLDSSQRKIMRSIRDSNYSQCKQKWWNEKTSKKSNSMFSCWWRQCAVCIRVMKRHCIILRSDKTGITCRVLGSTLKEMFLLLLICLQFWAYKNNIGYWEIVICLSASHVNTSFPPILDQKSEETDRELIGPTKRLSWWGIAVHVKETLRYGWQRRKSPHEFSR